MNIDVSYLSQIPNEHKQRGLQAMGLSVAVVLGFNIGGGNLRDRLASGLNSISVECPLSTSVNLCRCFNTCRFSAYCSIIIIQLIALSSHCCRVINVPCVFSDLSSTTLLPLIKISWGSTITEKRNAKQTKD